jgi:hypothetical protein
MTYDPSIDLIIVGLGALAFAAVFRCAARRDRLQKVRR